MAIDGAVRYPMPVGRQPGAAGGARATRRRATQLRGYADAGYAAYGLVRQTTEARAAERAGALASTVLGQDEFARLVPWAVSTAAMTRSCGCNVESDLRVIGEAA